MGKKISFLTTIFPMEKQYLFDFFSSIERQTFSLFDIIVINDGYEKLEEFKSLFDTLRIIELKVSDTPVKNREHGINYILKNNYDVIIFGDSDDYFKENRIKVCLDKLNKYDVVVNDLTLFNQNGIYHKQYISNRIKNNTEINLKLIIDKNIFGLSNTAINTKIIKGQVNFDSGLIALDWYIFSVFLLQSNIALFTNDTETYYRQHENNTIGIGEASEESILKGISVKIKHYKALTKIDEQYEYLYKTMNDLHDKIRNPKYLDKLLKQEIVTPLWWEEIRSIEEIT